MDPAVVPWGTRHHSQVRRRQAEGRRLAPAALPRYGAVALQRAWPSRVASEGLRPCSAHGLSAAASGKATTSIVHLRAFAQHIRAQQQQPQRRPEYVPNRIDDPNCMLIFDNPMLHDGEQSPSATMTTTKKLVVTHQLACLGVNIIKAGFRSSYPDDLDAVSSIVIEVGIGNNPPASEKPVGVDVEGTGACAPSRCVLGFDCFGPLEVVPSFRTHRKARVPSPGETGAPALLSRHTYVPCNRT